MDRPTSSIRSTIDSMTRHRRELLLGLILLGALALRVASLDSFLTTDENLWASRARHFAQALRAARLADTYQAQHPGVVTMWVGTISIAVGLVEDDGDQTAVIFGARRLAALLNWAGLALMCLLVGRLFDRRVALVAALLIGLDPFYVAHSRLLHLDAFLTTFIMLSLLSLLLYFDSLRPAYLLLSSACAALAALSKSPGLIMLPFGALLIAAWGLWRRQSLLRTLRQCVLWSLVAMVTVVALWPALWVAPGLTAARVWQGVQDQGLSPHENGNFFLGRFTLDPGPLFYPIAWLFRASPWILVGVAVFLLSALFRARFGHGERRAQLCTLCAFAVLFAIPLSLAAKKFDRYLLPVFPLFDLVAAWGLVSLSRQMGPRRQPLAFAALAAVQLALVLPQHPYYLSYYNPLAGGARTAVETLLVGWGEGMEQVAAYLNSKADAEQLSVIAWGEATLAPFFRGNVLTPQESDYTADYVVVYVNERQRDPESVRDACPEGPEKVIRVKGIDYAWICSTDQARGPLLAYLREHVGPQDIMLLSKPAPHLITALPGHVVATDDDPEVTLRQLGQASGRLWYVHEPYETVPLRAFDQLLAARCRKLAEDSFPLAHVVTYELPPVSPGSDGLEHSQQLAFAPGDGDGEALSLVYYRVVTTQLDFRQQVGVTLEWVSSVDTDRDLKIAWRVRDARGRVWGGIDRPLVNAKGHGTSRWPVGTHHQTRHLIPLLPGLPPGPYYLDLSLYYEPTMEQFTYRQAGGTWRHPPYVLTNLDVTPCPSPPTLEELSIPQPRLEPLSEGLTLLGLTPWPDTAYPGEALSLELFWEATGDDSVDWAVSLELRDVQGQVVASAVRPVVAPRYPTNQWLTGERVRGRYELLIPSLTQPGVHLLLLSLVDHATGRVTPSVDLGQVTVQGRRHQFAVPEVQHAQEAHLGQEMELLGYDLPNTSLSPGQELSLTLYWQARAEMLTSYTVFVHLLDGVEQIWGQRDSLPGEGVWPTTSWVPGEVLSDRYVVPIQKSAPPGEYQLEVGMYDAATGDRLPVFDAEGRRVAGDRVLLDTLITVR